MLFRSPQTVRPRAWPPCQQSHGEDGSNLHHSRKLAHEWGAGIYGSSTVSTAIRGNVFENLLFAARPAHGEFLDFVRRAPRPK